MVGNFLWLDRANPLIRYILFIRLCHSPEPYFPKVVAQFSRIVG